MIFTAHTSGYAGTFFEMASSDTAQSLDKNNISNGTQGAIALNIYVENNPIRLRYDGEDAVAGGTGILVPAGSGFSIERDISIMDLSFISENSGSPAKVVFIPFYNEGV